MFLEVMSPDEVNGYLDDFRANFYLLDKSLIKEDGNDGLACYKKYSNEGRGMAPELIQSLSTLAQQIQEGRFVPSEESRVMLVDLFVIYSNHIDQQQKDTLYPKLPEARKQAVVLLFLDAAKTLISPLLLEPFVLEEVDPSILSTLAQEEFFSSKAARYRGIADEIRLKDAQSAVNIVEHLDKLSLSATKDHNAFRARLETFKVVEYHCALGCGRYDEAIEIRQSATQSSDPTTRAHGFLQIAEAALMKYKVLGQGIELAFESIKRAMEVNLSENPVMRYNVRVTQANVLFAKRQFEEARLVAKSILDEMDKDSNCGAKPNHREAAEKVLADIKKIEELAEESESSSLRP